jgi:hypothetical protein
VRTATHFALSAGHASVLPADFKAAAGGDQPAERPLHREEVSQFDPSTVAILHSVFAEALKDNRLVEPQDLINGFS